MQTASYPSPTNPQVSLPRLSILGQPPLEASPADRNLTERAVQGAQPIDAVEKPSPASIMVGLDDKGKAHASWFAADQADAAARAASLMGLAIMEIAGEELAAVAAGLPQGKLFESGKAFVPFVKRSTYDALAAHLDDEYLAAAAKRVEAAASGHYAKASKGEVEPRSHPDHWSKIAAGDIVLASEGPDDGWWEATVTTVQEGENYLLSWTDWPELDQFTRHITQLALLHPKFTSEAPE